MALVEMMTAARMYENLIESLRERRKDLGYSQERVARLIGVHPYRISLYENLVHIPNAGTIAEWASALGMELGVKEGDE